MKNNVLNAGALNRPITILQPATVQDSYGAPVTTYAPVYQTWASIDVQTSQLIYATSEFVSKVTWRFVIRFDPSLSLNFQDRIEYTDAGGNLHTYEIQTVMNQGEMNRSILILAYELDGTA